jgi:Flp pilus assembly protein TadB
VTPGLAGICGSSLVGGLLLAVAGLRKVPAEGRPAGSGSRRPRLLAALLGDDLPEPRRRARRLLLAIAFAAGVLVWLTLGLALAVLLCPLLVVGVPALLRNSTAATDVSRLTAIEQWTRGMSGVLTVGSGIEHAIAASVGSTPPAIAPMVNTLAARLHARWPTDAALRAFADDLDDATGDLVAATLILGAHRRGPGLAAVLDDLAATVAEEVRIRRGIEADRAKPRTTARWVTILTLAILGILALNTSYVRPYGTPLGQVALAVFLGMYVGCLFWLRAMTRGTPTPRFLPPPDPARGRGGYR